MPAPNAVEQVLQIPIKMVGGNNFGRYNKISAEQTFNMIVSDNFLVPYAGYKNIKTISSSKGRGIYQSNTDDAIYMVAGNEAFRIDKYFNSNLIGTLSSDSGDVFISENNGGQIVITDYQRMYVYNYIEITTTSPITPKGTFQKSITSGTPIPNETFTVYFDRPGYVSFQNGNIIVVNEGTQNWYLSGPNNATSWSNTAAFVGALQTKPDKIQAVVPVPGGGNNVFVFGNNVVESWQFTTGKALFPYTRAQATSYDFGCLNPSSIAALDTSIVWLGANEQSGATVMAYTNGVLQSISTDGIDFKLNGLTNPGNCTGFLFRQDGHLIYQFCFPDDNLSYAYDFNSGLFFTVTDEKLDYHIARGVVFYNNSYYFASLNDGGLYLFGTQITDYEYSPTRIKEIPRIRICPPFRLPSQRFFIIKSAGFTIENGQPNTINVKNYTQPINIINQDDSYLVTQNSIQLIYNQGDIVSTSEVSSSAVDLSISRDGAENFGSGIRLNMNPSGKRISRFIWQRLGRANDVSLQFQFWGFTRFVATDGIMEVFE